MQRRAIVWGVIVLVGAIASYFTVSSGQAVKWNDRVVAIHARFGTAWNPLKPHVLGWLQGKAVDPAPFDAALAQYGRDIGQAAAELRRETPPDDELCKSMHAELVKFAELEEAQAAEVKKLGGEMKASNPGRPEDIVRVAGALDALGKKEAAQQSVVKARQSAMASKFKLKMK